MTTSVVVGRFQIDKLHQGHIHIINEARKRGDKIVIVIGDSPLNYTDRNPLPFLMRKGMLVEAFPDAEILRTEDNPSDEVWSQNLDALLEKYENITLYGSRDSFIPKYSGKHATINIGSVPNISSTAIRKDLGKSHIGSSTFRAGIIHAIENRYGTAYPTVDIALIKYRAGGGDDHHIFLGRKPGKAHFCFPGGFVDPGDSSLEIAANRELNEEVTGINTHGLPKYISSHRINDFRYRGTKDGIITSFFVSYFMSGNPQAGDDLQEVREFPIKGFDMDMLAEHHHVLFHSLEHYLNELI